MSRNLSASLWLLGFTVAITCGAYPLTLWAIGQAVFPSQAEGSLLRGPDGTAVGSRLIAQPFTKDEYFHTRPSAVSYNAAASGATNWAASNYLLRDRVARALGPIVKYGAGPKKGGLVGPDVEAWFRQDRFGGQPHIVAQWAEAHSGLAQAWVKADPANSQFVQAWMASHEAEVAQWKKDNPDTAEPAPEDLAVPFFESFSKASPGMWLAIEAQPGADGKPVNVVRGVDESADVQGVFFDMWRQDHPDTNLEPVPADMVMASGSGLDPHITLKNAVYQLDRVADAWATDTHRDAKAIRDEILEVLHRKSFAPLGGLVGVDMVNVLEVNVELRTRYGEPPAPTT